MENFVETGLSEEILAGIQELGFEKPTPIQAKTIPHILSSDQDVIALAQTGTGKTAAFGLPLIELVSVEEKHTQAIILCPTRELCLQIASDLSDYSKHVKGLKIQAVYGGSSIDKQISGLKRGAQIVVGTPGRTVDLIRRKVLKLAKVERVVLDEADEMLTMGFKDDLETILAETPVEKQTLLFSATMSREIIDVTRTYMDSPIQLSVAARNRGADSVEHVFYVVSARDKYEVLKRLADLNPDIYGIVFCRTRKETKDIALKLADDGYSADALHGDMSQAQRDEVMRRFRRRQIQILVATDVAARGLDVDDLTHVINFTLPDMAETYTHRSGRTGRAGKKGISVAITHTREKRKIRDIERASGVRFKQEMVPSGQEICSVQLLALIDRIEQVEVDKQQIEPFLPTIHEKLSMLSKEDLIEHVVSAEFNRFLAYYKDARDLNIPDRRRRDRERDREFGDRDGYSRRRRPPFSRLFINVGSKNHLTPARLIGLVNEGLDSNKAEIGKIEIMRKFSFFEIEEGESSRLINALEGVHFEGVELNIERSKATENPAPKRPYGKKKKGFFQENGGPKGKSKSKRRRKRK
ncbi:MAG: DEAD/DEAH box helicase [Bacteroidota bacterium]